MRIFITACVLACVAPAQNFLVNGDFSNGISGWTETGYSAAPGAETADVTGLGVDPSYGCHPGGLASPGPYPPNTIEQTITIPAGVPLEITADLMVDRPTPTANSDAGTFWITVGGIEVARVALGNYIAGATLRARLTGRFVHPVGGPQLVQLSFHRRFLGTTATPRAHVDNLRLFAAPGLTVAIDGNRRVNGDVTLVAAGANQAPFVVFLSAGATPGIPIPGIGGQLLLDPTTLAPFFSGQLGNDGRFTRPMRLPNDRVLLLAPLWMQGAHFVQGQLWLGNAPFLTFVD